MAWGGNTTTTAGNDQPDSALPGGGVYTPPYVSPVPGGGVTVGPPPSATPPDVPTAPGSGTSTPNPPGTQPGMDSTQQNAWAILAATLQGYGFTGQDLQDLEDFVQKELINGTGDAQITSDLMKTKQFAKRFPAIISRQNQGLPPINPAEYIALERSYAQLERAAGLPPNFTDQSHYDSLIANDVSANEYSNRIQQGYVAMLQAPPEATQVLQDYYGITQGALAAHFLDPDLAAPILAQQAQSAIIGAAGLRTGFGEPTEAQAMRLAQLGITGAAAQAGFGDLTHQSQLTGTLPGQSQTAIDAGQLIGAEFEGDQTTKDLLARRAQEQKNQFAQGGGFTNTQTGVTGIGSVTR